MVGARHHQGEPAREPHGPTKALVDALHVAEYLKEAADAIEGTDWPAARVLPADVARDHHHQEGGGARNDGPPLMRARLPSRRAGWHQLWSTRGISGSRATRVREAVADRHERDAWAIRLRLHWCVAWTIERTSPRAVWEVHGRGEEKGAPFNGTRHLQRTRSSAREAGV